MKSEFHPEEDMLRETLFSLFPSGTTSIGPGTTSSAWPGLPKMSWLRSLTSSSPTCGPVGSSLRLHRLHTRRRGSPSKPRYKEQGPELSLVAVVYARHTSISLQPLSMPCRRGTRWSFSCSRSCTSGQSRGALEGKANKSVYFHCQAFL